MAGNVKRFSMSPLEHLVPGPRLFGKWCRISFPNKIGRKTNVVRRRFGYWSSLMRQSFVLFCVWWTSAIRLFTDNRVYKLCLSWSFSFRSPSIWWLCFQNTTEKCIFLQSSSTENLLYECIRIYYRDLKNVKRNKGLYFTKYFQIVFLKIYFTNNSGFSKRTVLFQLFCLEKQTNKKWINVLVVSFTAIVWTRHATLSFTIDTAVT